MSENHDNCDNFEQLDAALRREITPCDPLEPELSERIVSSIRAESRRRRRAIVLRRFTYGAAALAAGVVLAIGLLFNNGTPIERPVTTTPGSDPDLISKIEPAGLVDDSLAAMKAFAAESMAREMRDLAQDASDIGSGILASLPGDVVDSQLWMGLGGK
jgi:hypothetical protein